ncbi:UNVERIFIED_CONTAM: hypothetical protein K2H54_049153 [Gekko kuhli]
MQRKKDLYRFLQINSTIHRTTTFHTLSLLASHWSEMFTSPPIRIPPPRLHSDSDIHFTSNLNSTTTSPLRLRCSLRLQSEFHRHVSTPTPMFTSPPIRIPPHLSTPTQMFTSPPIRIPPPRLHSDSDIHFTSNLNSTTMSPLRLRCSLPLQSEFHCHVSTPTPTFTSPPIRIPPHLSTPTQMFTSPPIRIPPPRLHSDSDIHFTSNPNSTTTSPLRLRCSLPLQSEFHCHVSTPTPTFTSPPIRIPPHLSTPTQMFTSPPIRIPPPRLHSDSDIHFTSNPNSTATSPLQLRCSLRLQSECHRHVSTPTPMFTLPPIQIPPPRLHSDSNVNFASKPNSTTMSPL